MALKFYTDTHITKAVAVQLRNRGIDVIRCEEIGMADASDLAHLEYAAKENRVIITQDADFLRLHQDWQIQHKTHSGIMYCVPRIQGKQFAGKIIQEVMVYYELIAAEAGNIETDIANHVFYIS